MAFLTPTDLATEVTTTTYVERLLLQIQMELEGAGMVFDTPTAKTLKLTPENGSSQSIFEMYWVGECQNIQIKNSSGSSTMLVLDQDYKLIQHPNILGYFNGIQLLRARISNPNYVEVTTTKGLYINFSDANSKPAKLLKGIIIDYVVKMVGHKTNDFKNITQAGTGDSKIVYDLTESYRYTSSLLDDLEFNSLLETYFRII